MPQCRHCIARWIRDESARHDVDMAFMATQALLPFTQPSGANDGNLIAGFEALKSSMMISSDIACELHMDLVNLGACDVRELMRPDWLALPVYQIPFSIVKTW